MQAWRIAKRAYALDRQGTGARLTGGRWNSSGVAAVYAGLTPEIAAMEKLVHASDMLPRDLVLARFDLPADDRLYRRYTVEDLPDGWDALPSSTAAIAIGDAFLLAATHLGLIVPSAVMPEACNVVLNPNHPEFGVVAISIIRPFEFDSRLRG
ncbi:MAG TPA: RES family NAD+ phosphorylase [Gallionella sp.]|nr:RES family NAD+ phosphorylase [Gallionella sp.]